MKTLNLVAFILTIVGAVNWGLVGIANLDLVATLFGAGSALSQIVYILVGVSGLYCITLFKAVCHCGKTTITTP